MKEYKPMALGELETRLSEITDVNSPVYFDFCGYCPVDIGSSRGSYDEPALIPGFPREKSTQPPIVIQFVQHLIERALTEHFSGWKGGQYRYSRDSPVWVDYDGAWTATAVVDVAQGHPWFGGGAVVLITAPGNQRSGLIWQNDHPKRK